MKRNFHIQHYLASTFFPIIFLFGFMVLSVTSGVFSWRMVVKIRVPVLGIAWKNKSGHCEWGYSSFRNKSRYVKGSVQWKLLGQHGEKNKMLVSGLGQFWLLFFLPMTRRNKIPRNLIYASISVSPAFGSFRLPSCSCTPVVPVIPAGH